MSMSKDERPDIKQISDLNKNKRFSKKSIYNKANEFLFSIEKNAQSFEDLIKKATSRGYQLNLKRFIDKALKSNNNDITPILETIDKFWSIQHGGKKDQFYDYLKQKIFNSPNNSHTEATLDFVYKKQPHQFDLDQQNWQQKNEHKNDNKTLIDAYFKTRQSKDFDHQLKNDDQRKNKNEQINDVIERKRPTPFGTQRPSPF